MENRGVQKASGENRCFDMSSFSFHMFFLLIFHSGRVFRGVGDANGWPQRTRHAGSRLLWCRPGTDILAMLVSRSPVSSPCNTPPAATHHPGTRLELQDRPIFIVGGAHAMPLTNHYCTIRSVTPVFYQHIEQGGLEGHMRALHTEILSLHQSVNRVVGAVALSIVNVLSMDIPNEVVCDGLP